MFAEIDRLKTALAEAAGREAEERRLREVAEAEAGASGDSSGLLTKATQRCIAMK